MAEEIAFAALALIAAQLAPGATVARTWPLRGGISAAMSALELVLPDGARRRVVVRQPGDWELTNNPHAAAHQHRVLELVRAAGVTAPAPLLVDESCTILPRPYLVLEYVDGQVEHSPADVGAFAAQLAAELARIHRLDATQPELAWLPTGEAWLADARAEKLVEPDEALGPRPVRAVLRAAHPLPHPNPPVLLHGDPWPGNIVWRDGRLAALIDWEETHRGDPLEDIAIARFDVLCMLGHAGMEQLTAAYAAAAPQVDFTDLPYWDLYAALRPADNLPDWAGGWADLGRPDITEHVMRAYHREFVAQAMARLRA